MHGAATASAAAFLLAEHLGHDDASRDAFGQGLAVLAVGGKDGVGWAQVLHYAHGDGFFTVVEVHEAAYLHGAVHLCGLIFETPDAHHLSQQVVGMLSVQLFGEDGRFLGHSLGAHQIPPVVGEASSWVRLASGAGCTMAGYPAPYSRNQRR